jgi:NADPH2:quinone reductase
MHLPQHTTAMRAFVIAEYAHPSKIQLTHNAPEPVRKPGSDELLIDVHSAGLNFLDVSLSQSGALYRGHRHFSDIMANK